MKDWPKVTKVSGGYKLDSLRGLAKRRRVTVETKEEAEKLAQDWRDERETAGKDLFLTPKQRGDALSAYKLFEEKGVTGHSLVEAVGFFLARKYPNGGDITLSELVNIYVLDKESQTRVVDGKTVPRYSYAYLNSFHRFERFAEAFENVKLSNLKAESVRQWLEGRGLNDYSKRQYHQYFAMLFHYAKKRGHMQENPMDSIPIPHVVAKDPEILTLQQARNLVEKAWTEFDGFFFPYVVLNLFCGIRPKELHRLTWKMVSKTYVRLDASITKTNDIRNVTIPFNARIMLDQWHERKGYKKVGKDLLICDELNEHKFRREFKRLYRRANINTWPRDGGRHTFASFYHAAVEGNMSKVQARLGHAKPKMSLQHYVNLTASSWIEYFTIIAPEDLKVILTNLVEDCKTAKDEIGLPALDLNKLREGLFLMQV